MWRHAAGIDSAVAIEVPGEGEPVMLRVGRRRGVEANGQRFVLYRPTTLRGPAPGVVFLPGLMAMESQYERRVLRTDGAEVTAAGRHAAATAGMRTRLTGLPAGRGRAAAAFDTCMTGPLTGGARAAIVQHPRVRHPAGPTQPDAK